MLIEAKPNLKVIKLDGLTANTNVDIPAMHSVEAIYMINRLTKFSPLPVIFGKQVGDAWISARPDQNYGPALWDADHALSLTSSDWTDVELDVLMVLVNLSV